MKDRTRYKYLFNFSVSYSGGGLKRLSEYAKWFNNNGGAHFIIHKNCSYLIKRYENNKYHLVHQTKLSRFFNDCAYLKKIVKENGPFDLYYAYGIPLYEKIAVVNWFHLSNVLPLVYKSVPIPLLRKFELVYLGSKIKANIGKAEVISAESNYSIDLIRPLKSSKSEFVVSHNGGDDELLNTKAIRDQRENIVVVVGTYSYKRIMDSYLVYKHLKKKILGLQLIIIGKQYNISSLLQNNADIKLTGNISRKEVVNYLKKARFYVSNTLIENSYNAASEGVFLAEESYISDIPPHRELLSNIEFKLCHIDGLKLPMIYLKREDIANLNIDSWDVVVNQMIGVVKKNLFKELNK